MRFLMRVADIATRVVCEDAGVSIGVTDPGSRFLVADAQPDVTIVVDRRRSLTQPDAEQLFDSGTWRLYRVDEGFLFSFSRLAPDLKVGPTPSPARGPAPYRLARFDSSFTTGRVSLNRHCLDDEFVEPLQYPLDELLMINLLAQGRGVEVHGCGVIDRDGAGYLFAGHSTAGKSTIARLWCSDGAVVLSDDRVVLRLRAGAVWMYGTPWHGEEGFASPACAPVSRIFFLEHGRENRARPVHGAAAAARLLARSFPPFYDEPGLDFTVGLLGDIVNRVPCSDLAFLPDSRVIRFIRERA